MVAKCLEKDRSRRFQRSAELREALDRLARDGFAQPLPAPPAVAVTAAAPPLGAAPSASGVLARGSRHPVCVMLSVSYGVMVGLALLVEIAYEWPAFGAWALPTATLTAALSVAVSALAFAILRGRVAEHRPHALLLTLAVFAVWTVILAMAIAPQLPGRPLVRAAFQTMTANVGYPKSLLEALTLPVLGVVPVQVVCALEAELRRGGAERVYRALTAEFQTLSIPGVMIVRPNAASIVFGTVAIWWMGANGRLLENLQSGPYYGLFLQLGIVRVASGLLMLFAVLVWYNWSLNDLRRVAREQMGGTSISG